MELANKVAIVTGASGGIGEAVARLLAEEDARVVLAARSAAKLEALAASLGIERALAVPTDVADPAQIERLVTRTLDRFGGVDILVNNAGIGLFGWVQEMDWEHFRRMWEVNFFGLVHLTRAALPHLRARRGTVVNISSVAGKIPLPTSAAYCATKSALNAFSSGLRMELARTGVRVITVCPGFVRTEFHQNAYLDGSQPPGVARRRGNRGVSAERVARATLRAVRNGRREIVVPWTMRLAMGFHALFPGLTEDGMRWLVARAERG